ncbi:MAG: ABC transporter permease [Planctomycetes bacterium]|nr:ABC transporter permease [Planctomycetota bacterium]
MKFWSILKDSFREAIDCKVLYVMAGLSFLIILFVGSTTFRPVSAKETMQNLLSGEFLFVTRALQNDPESKNRSAVPPRFEGPFRLRDVRAAKGEMDSPDSEYLLIVSQDHASAEEAGKTRRAPELALETLKNLFTFAEQWKLLHIAEIRVLQAPPEGIRKSNLEPQLVFFQIHTQPTEATRRLWQHEPALLFGAVPLHVKQPLGIMLYVLASIVLSIGSWVTILVSVIITAFFIPNMLRKGTVDLLLAKPISRWSLLGYKYLGGLFFIFLNTAFAVVGIWAALGLRSGIWANSFLLMIFVITFFFAILYAVSTLFAVMTRSAVVCILMTCGAWFLFFLVGTINQVVDTQQQKEIADEVARHERTSEGTFASVVKVVHAITPRTSDLNYLAGKILLSDFLTGDFASAANLDKTSITWESSVAVSLAFVALMLGLACWRFAAKDY